MAWGHVLAPDELQLDEAERAHLFDLARAANSSAARSAADPRRHDRFGYALYSPLAASPARSANNARFAFLDPRATLSAHR